MNSAEIKAKYGLPSFRAWADVPQNICSKTEAKRRKIKIPADAKPDAVKNSSAANAKDRIFFLFDTDKYKKA